MSKKVVESINSGIYDTVKQILQSARDNAYRQINFVMVEAYWNIGKQIVQEEQNGKDRAEYGSYLIKELSEQLTADFRKGFTTTNLKMMRQFYNAFPNSHTLCDQLSWSHYRLLIRIKNEDAREWYIEESNKSNWSVRALERQIGTHYFERILYIDLVFYNYILKCFVIIDLKRGKLTHQDIGQMDMYVNMFNDLEKATEDNPTIGIILCADKDNTVVKYSSIKDNDNLFVSKYQMYLPTEEELKAELEKDILELRMRVEI